MWDSFWVWAAIIFLYLIGIGGTITYYQSNNVNPVEVCEGVSRAEEWRLAYDKYYHRVSPYDECIKENSVDEAGEVVMAVIWPITLPIVIGRRELDL